MEVQMSKSFKERKSSYGWVVVVTGFVITMIVYGITSSLAVFFKPLVQSFQWGRGQTSLIWAANWMTFSVLAIIIGPLIDRFGARKTMFAGFLLVQGLGVLLFLRPDQLWLLYLGIIVWGMAMAGPMSCYPMLYRQYFGKRHLAMLMSGFYTAGGLGMALGGLFAGVLFDVTGGYQLSFAIILIGGVGAALIAMTLQPPNRSMVGGHEGIGPKPVPA
jgi:MFS family permease